MKIYPKCRTKNLIVREMENEVLVYDLEGNCAVCLNQTSALIWKLCDGQTSPAEIAEFLAKRGARGCR